MIEQLSIYISEQFMKHCFITEAQKNEYIYAIETLLEKGITYSCMLILALYNKVLIPTLFFMSFFFLLRKYTGGFHLKHYTSCLCGTLGIYFFLIRWGNEIFQKNIKIFCIAFIISGCYLLLVGSVNHPAMDWDSQEFKEAKRNARYLVFIEIDCIMIERCLYLDITNIIYSMFALELCAVLLFLSKIFHQEVKKT